MLRTELVDELRSALGERRADDNTVEAGGLRGAEARRVRVVRVAEKGDVRVGVRDLFGLDAGDVGDHEIGGVHAVGRDDLVRRAEQSIQLRSKEEIDPCHQDRRHGVRSVTPLETSEKACASVRPMPGSELVAVARLDELPPGSLRQVELDGVEVALANVKGSVYALQGRCPHLRGPLGRGRLDGCVLTCPFHGWQYDVRTGKNEFDRAITLDRYEVAVEGGEIRVALPRG
jgi:nitrite reductase (NADH) small subunit